MTFEAPEEQKVWYFKLWLTNLGEVTWAIQFCESSWWVCYCVLLVNHLKASKSQKKMLLQIEYCSLPQPKFTHPLRATLPLNPHHTKLTLFQPHHTNLNQFTHLHQFTIRNLCILHTDRNLQPQCTETHSSLVVRMGTLKITNLMVFLFLSLFLTMWRLYSAWHNTFKVHQSFSWPWTWSWARFFILKPFWLFLESQSEEDLTFSPHNEVHDNSVNCNFLFKGQSRLAFLLKP